MKLINFKKQHNQTLIDWVKEEEIFFLFAALSLPYPLTSEHLEEYFLKNPERKAYLGLDDDGIPIAFGEIIPQDEESSRLGHLIIGESQHRGKGYGQALIKALNLEAKSISKIQRMELFVYEKNDAAINCYLKSGFRWIPNDLTISYKGKDYIILKMTMDL
jgi:RimJ/RimL family protein N-acetyltransferase